MKLLERAVAAGYALGYDAVVDGFAPHVALLEEIESFVRRARPSASPRDIAVLDAACGNGNVCMHLAARGYTVCGVDAVERLITAARKKREAAGAPPNLRFEHLDIARDPLEPLDAAPPGALPPSNLFDVVVNVNALYWHPDPTALLRGCRRALRANGHAVFLTYDRPAHVVRTALEVRAAGGNRASVRALRWLVPTAIFELLRDFTPRYLNAAQFHALLDDAGFELLEARETFLAGLCHLAWVRART